MGHLCSLGTQYGKNTEHDVKHL